MIPSKFSGPKGIVSTWTGGNVDMNKLEEQRKAVPASMDKGIYINGAFVVNLEFEGGRNWNCKIGWGTPDTQASER